MPESLAVAVVGASGFAGGELLRLLAGHPNLTVEVATADSLAGRAVAEVHPGLAAAYPTLPLDPWSPDAVLGLDLVFFALPHGASQELVPKVIDQVGHVIDLGADFRLSDPAAYEQWYGAQHTRPDLLGRFAYGLPELFSPGLTDRCHVAVPGCYPTAALLALGPLLGAGLIESEGLIIDAVSGVSGAGRKLTETTAFCTVDENFTAYGLVDHRHTVEIDQGLTWVAGHEVQALFTPHLAPMNRGILATCYARPTGHSSEADLRAALDGAYESAAFVAVRDDPPGTKATLGSNAAHVAARLDPRTRTVIAMCAIDNLGKGAAGQALQCANMVCDLPEGAGLSTVGVAP